jgi:hypothetical protein
MPHVRIPLTNMVPVKDLRPTQMTVGLREVETKRKRWRESDEGNRAKFLARHLVPVVEGPKGNLYVTDHHHLARALIDEGAKEVMIIVIANLKKLEKDAFWIYLDNRGWLHPFDDDGRRRDYADIPKGIADLVDDPFRSLAGELRRVGGFAKDTTPFSEFLWADFLRRRLKRKAVEADFTAAVEEALRLAKSGDADYLPGWCGPAGE